MSHPDPVVQARMLRENRRVRKERFAAGLITDIKHGAYGYREYGCKCEVCMDGQRAEKEAYSRARGVTRSTNRTYTDEQRAEAVAIAVERGAVAAAEALGINVGLIREWARKAGVKAAPPPRPGDEHGSTARYARGCRCLECRRANREKCYGVKATLRERAAADPSVVPHGTVGGYQNYACRCEPCTKANTEACRPAKQRWEARNRKRAG